MSPKLSLLKFTSESALKSQRRRCLHTLESSGRAGEGSVSRVLAGRRYAATATASARSDDSRQQRVEYLDDEDMDGSSSQRTRPYASSRNSDMGAPYREPRSKANGAPLVEHLQQIFPPLAFPETVATQMLTHISAKEAWAGHNARLAFVGRRVLHSYLLLFLQSASQKLARSSSSPPNLHSTFDFDRIAYRTLHTPLLGEFVGAQWDLANMMLWTPAVSSAVKATVNTPLSRLYAGDEQRVHHTPASLKSPGLYKVQGTTVEGVMGGVFHQFGGTIAQRVFHTRLLPHILCPGTSFGLDDTFHTAALEIQERMGGADGLLATPEAARSQKSNMQSYAFATGGATQRPSASRETTPTQRKRLLS